MRRHFTALLLLALGACSSSTSAESGGSEVVVELGKTAAIDDTGVTVGLRSVEDGRCPTNVLCFTQGNARIGLELNFAGLPGASGELNTDNGMGARQLTFRFLSITLEDVEPYPVYQQPPAHPYRARLRWSYLRD